MFTISLFTTRFFTVHNTTCTTSWKKDSYVIAKDLYARIWRLRLIFYNWFFSSLTVVFKGCMVRDMGTHRSPPTRVLEVPVKWTRPARSPTDLQVDPETLSTAPATLEDLMRPYQNPGRPAGLVAQVSPLRRGTTPPVGPPIAGFTL
jgi:hypothetical protein